MATQSLRMLEGNENWLSHKQSTSYGGSASASIEDLGLFLKGQRFNNLGKDIAPNRSESAPPSMEGSIAALENILSWRTSNLNPVLVHPSVSNAEDSMLLPTGNLPVPIEEEVEDDISSEMSGSLIVEKGVLLTHNEDAFDLMQEDSHQTSLPSYQYCSSSDKSTDKTVNLERDSVSASTSAANIPSREDGNRRILVRPPPIETHFNTLNLDPKNDLVTAMVIDKDVAHIQSGIKGVGLSSASNSDYHKIQHNMQVFSDNNMQQNVSPQQGNPYRAQLIRAYSSNHFHYGSSSISTPEAQPIPILQSPGFTPPLYASAAALMASTNPFHPSVLPSGYHASQYAVGGYTFHPSVLGISMQPSLSDPLHMQYIRRPVQDSYGVYGHFGHPTPRYGAIMSQLNAFDPKNRPQLIAYSTNQNILHPSVAGYNNLNPSRGPFGSPTNMGPYVQFPISSVISPNWGGANTFSFLEDLKLGKGQKYKLSDIAGRVAEVSVDQHGSRFIQQKLEYCSAEEKESLFKEVVPSASKLMTDVFGNYVIQKLFEFGTATQRKDLANQLIDQVLPLSLQMYGCRVIQKALEVIDIEQKVKLVRELNGHVMTCVRDQNGNHVVQKCIESTPAADIGFIISSFRGEVASLSMHPYGCRVIQRVLEHCNEELQTQFIVDEILRSVCTLIQDQYGNYVTQHVLERGKPHERSQIIRKITGSVVQLSQHKFASNVVEKCLEYGDSAAREILIKEIIGHEDKNDNLLIMMKDQYANYVIQKMLQKCCDDQREVLLGLIRNHLAAIKKYTYGKHIVARFEHLCGQEIETSES